MPGAQGRNRLCEMLRLTDEDENQALGPFLVACGARGYILDSMSAAAIRGDVMTRVRRVVERGDVAWSEEGHYGLTRAAYERLKAKNAAQPRSRQRARG